MFRKILFYLTIFITITMIKLSNGNDECQSDSDCYSLNVCDNKKCKHKMFIPPTYIEIIGLFCITLGSILSNTGGLRGGSLFILNLILVLKFDTYEAIPISNFMILTGAVIVFVIERKTKHPYRDTIALDYNIAGLFIPSMILGTTFGVTLNKMLPFGVLSIFLVIVLITNTYKTFKNAFKNYHSENLEMEAKVSVQKFEIIQINDNSDLFENNKKTDIRNEENQSFNELDPIYIGKPKISFVVNDSNQKTNMIEPKFDEYTKEEKNFCNSRKLELMAIDLNENPQNLIEEELRKDRTIFPIEKYKYIIVSYVILIIFSLLRGNEYLKSIIGVIPCSLPYWMIYFNIFPLIFGITIKFAKQILNEYKKRKEIGFPYHSSDIKWNTKIMILYPIYSFIGGVLAGFLGIGGGLIINPMLLDMGIHPIISNVTANFLVFFQTSSATIQYALTGMINFKYGLICTFFSTIGCLIGVSIINNFVKKTRRPSILMFALAILLFVTTFIRTWETIIEIKKKTDKGFNVWKMKSAC